MAAADMELQLYAIYFLKQLDEEEGFSRYYIKELTSRYRHFTKRNPQADRYSFGAMLNYLRQKKFVYMSRKQVIKKPLFVNTKPGQHLVFTINPGSEQSGEYFVCQVCSRGFATRDGLGTHHFSDYHTERMNQLCQSISNNFTCPMLECRFRGEHREDLRQHFLTNKSIKVTRDGSKNVRFQGGMQENYYCDICCVRCTSDHSLQQHKGGKKHKMNEFRNMYRQGRQQLILNKDEIDVTFEHDGDGDPGALLNVSGAQNVDKAVTLTITNKGSSHITLESCVHFHFINPKNITLSHQANVASGSSRRIKARATYEVCVTIRPTYFGMIRVPVLLVFRRNKNEVKILREIFFNCVTNPELFAEIQPVAPYVKPPKKEALALRVIRSNVKPLLDRNKIALERDIKLDQYLEPRYIQELIDEIAAADNEEDAKERWTQIMPQLKLGTLQPDTYSEGFSNLLYIEENQMRIDINHYSMENVPMRKDKRTNLIVVEVPGLAEKRPSVLKGDQIFAIRDPREGDKFEGQVESVLNTSLKLSFNSRLTDGFIDNMTFNIEFTINRFSLRLEHRAMSKHFTGRIKQLLFPSPGISLPPQPAREFRFFNRDIESNFEQNTAVRRIVARSSGTAPYLIYGPPGTGKTFTLVEAIKQVYTQFPNCKILACAPQNAAADLITKRLLDHVDKRDILRLNAPSRSYEDVITEVQKVSNYSSKSGAVSGVARRQVFSGSSGAGDMEVELPPRDILKQRKILVSTLVTSGRLVSADMKDHFTHIFIDEAGHATEPETVIPLSGLIGSSRSDVQVVLAGDPKQLGPVIRSPLAIALGKSLLERLMSCDLYKKDPLKEQFNQNYVTKLVRSFRSHPDILEVPNSCFYDNELLACADTMQRERLCHWEGLPEQGFPMVFHGVNGPEQREANSPSWFNTYEVMQVIEYVRLLMECKSPRVRPEHIGIISPYHQQVNKIIKGLKVLETQTTGRTRNYANIKVGSVEKFQGDEREVIIISTVRSQDAYLTHDKDFNLGFVGNPKRFNVAVTRAKALLIVIGNPSILRRDSNWLRLINHIEEGGGYTGCPPPDEIEGEDIEDLTLLTESMTIKDALNQGASEHIQQGDQEWARKE